ncbi:hypothetical protein BTR23_00085 [Alkalihalophilus pseudofirmus]|nr:hypothetical protein BTR23_00085 [Alkalihalophilus pseudofirmus]
MKNSDVIFLKEAFYAMKNNEVEALRHLDQYYTAFKLEEELATASTKTGRSLLTGIIPLYTGKTLEALTHLKKLKISHYPVIYGAITSILDLSLEDAVYTYLYSSLSNLVYVSSRIIPLGQVESQKVLASIRDGMLNQPFDYESLTLNDISSFTPGLQLASLKHESLFSRLCMS